MDLKLSKRQNHHQIRSAPALLVRKPPETLTVLVTLPSQKVCSVRNVPLPGRVDWIKCQIELLVGILSKSYTLQYSDGAILSDNQPLNIRGSQTAVVLRLCFIGDYKSIWQTIIRNDWGTLKRYLDEERDFSNRGTDKKDDKVSITNACETRSPGEIELNPRRVRELDKTEGPPQNPLSVGDFALFLACRLGYDNLCRKLLDYGVDVNQKTYLNHTPLHAAVSGDNASTVEILLVHQADPIFSDNWNRTPLKLALRISAKQCVKVLRFRNRKQTKNHTFPETSHNTGDHSTGGTNKAQVTFAPELATDKDNASESKLSDALSSEKPGRHINFSSLLMLEKARLRFLKTKAIKDNEKSELPPAMNRRAASAGPHTRWSGVTSGGTTILEGNRRSHRRGSLKVYTMPHDAINGSGMISDEKLLNFVGTSRLTNSLTSPHSPKSETSSKEEETDSSAAPDTNRSTALDSRRSSLDSPLDLGKANELRSARTTDSAAATNGRQGSPRPPKTAWLSVKRKLRLAYLFKKAMERKSGQNDEAFQAWLDRKNNELKANKAKEKKNLRAKPDNTDANEEAFSDWLAEKQNAKPDYRVFRGLYKSAFVLGSTMCGNPVYPDVMENKNAFKNWLKGHRCPQIGLQTELPEGGDYRMTHAYKEMERQRRKMLTSAVTYEEWLDIKHTQEKFYKELEKLRSTELQKSTKTLVESKDFKHKNYNKWTRDETTRKSKPGLCSNGKKRT